jgi:hypothetical protein
VLLPGLRPGGVVIMDNQSSHTRAAVQEKIEATGAGKKVRLEHHG